MSPLHVMNSTVDQSQVRVPETVVAPGQQVQTSAYQTLRSATFAAVPKT